MTYRQFWPLYLREHARPLNRALHIIGTLAALAVLVLALATGEPWLVLATLALGYGFAWIGHVLVERNRPATFRHPLYSLLGDLHMTASFLTGRLGAELKRHGIHPPL